MDKLKKIIKPHVRGEYDKLRDCYEELILSNNEALSDIERGIYSDCFLLHARNLIDFLCKKNNKKGYVLVADFFADKKPTSRISDILTAEYYGKINIQLSHITYARLEKERQTDFFDRDNIFEKIFINIKRELEKFDNKIDQEYDPSDAKDLRILNRK